MYVCLCWDVRCFMLMLCIVVCLGCLLQFDLGLLVLVEFDVIVLGFMIN